MSRDLAATMLAACFLAVLVNPALAAITPDFFSGGDGTAGFETFTLAPPGATATSRSF